MEEKESEQASSKSTEYSPNPSELPEAWRRFFEEVRNAFADQQEKKE